MPVHRVILLGSPQLNAIRYAAVQGPVHIK